MITAEDIVNKRFSRSVLGYDIGEVDLFLDAVIEQFEAYERERKEMMTAMDYLLKELEQFDNVMEGVAAVKRERGMADGIPFEEEPVPAPEEIAEETGPDGAEPASTAEPAEAPAEVTAATAAGETAEENSSDETPQETETRPDDTEEQRPRDAENE